MAEPTQQPPQAAGEHPRVQVVGDDLDPLVDADPAEEAAQAVDVREGMASVRAGRSTRKVAIQIRKNGTWNVRAPVGSFAPGRIVQRELAVDHPERLVGEMRR